MKKHLLCLCIVLSWKVNSQTTVTLTASKDAAIGYHDGTGTAGNNYGTATQNAAFAVPAVSGSGLNVNRALIDFNLSTIPANATLISANLNLYALGPFGSLPGHSGTNNASYLERVTQTWQENTVTWNNQPTSTSSNHVTLNQSTSATQNYLNINVTSMVQDMLNNPSGSFGFMLKLISETPSNALAFASKDHSNSSLIPTLVITYSVNCNKTDSLIADYDAAIGYHDGTNTAGNNYGTAQQNAAFAVPAVSGTGLNVNRALIHFNLSSVPANATVTNAQLDLFAIGTIGSYPGHSGPNNNALIQRVTGNWAESTVTWNNQPTTTTTNQVQLTGTNNANQDYLNINVTSLVQDIISSSTNNGIMLKLVSETATNLLGFCSEDHPDSNKWPRLRVSYVCNNVSVKELQSIISEVTCFPNPAKKDIKFTIHTAKAGTGKLMVFDALGKVIKETKLGSENQAQHSITIDTGSLSPGIYYYSVSIENEQKAGKFIVE